MADTTDALRFDPTDAAAVMDPYPLYERLRAEDPVHWNPKGFWFLSRYKHVHALLNDPRLSNSPAPFALVHARNRDRFAAAEVANNLIAFKDAPEHPKLRGWVARAFAQHMMQAAPALEQIAGECATGLSPGRRIELVSELAVPFAARVICRVIGLPEEDARQVAIWSDDFFRLFHAIPDAEEFAKLNQSLSAFRDYMLTQVRAREGQPKNDLTSDLLASRSATGSREEIADNLMLLAADGVGNVQSGLVNCLYVLLREKELPAQIHGSAKDRAAVVDECLRLESPGQYQGRIALQPIELEGKMIRAHSIVLLGLAAANRDPEVFANAGNFDPARRRPQHLAFGSGAHMCMGNALVRKELSAMLSILLDGKFTLELPPEPMDWLARPGHRWMRRLVVSIGAVT
ncbi:MAG: cytochrome P450 [Pseudomonadota bacterium]